MLSTGQGSGKGERVELNYYWQKKLFILLQVRVALERVLLLITAKKLYFMRTFVIKVNKYFSQLLS